MENENTEIVFECNSLNNKNVRANELKILEKRPGELYFVFGENATNVKKRYYADEKTLDKDFEELKGIKKDLESGKKRNADEITREEIKEEIKEENKEKKTRKEDF